jgi:ankyrin repeat protein
MAAYFGATGAIAALLASGANIEAVTRNFLQNMPLHAAAAGGRIEAARALLQAGADPNARQHGANTPLMTAAFQNNRELVELLIAFNANVDLRNDEGKTAADVAAGLGNMELAARLRLQERVVDRGHLRRDTGG